MKRSKIATFKVKEEPKDKKTSKNFLIGDYFTIDFDKCMSDIQNRGMIYLRENNEIFKFYPNEVYMIRMSYIDRYDVDVDKDRKEFENYIK